MILRKVLAEDSKRILKLLTKPRNELTVHERLELQRYMEDTEKIEKR
ncbi:hypothetical protein [Alkalihalobacterium bogoriense]|nr:hypothetical protein [Alkalihalobacterium bogoriense]